MKNTLYLAINQNLTIMKLPDNTRENPEVISYRVIRRSIGFLGILLPFGLVAMAYLLGCRQLQPSISHYYYTMAGSLLVGVLCAVGLFLISYKGFSPLDDFATNFAGICAFGVAFLPTENSDGSVCALFKYPDSGLRSGLHYGSASLLFLTLAFISFFLFTRSKGEKTKEKYTRNVIYRVCAVLMLLFIVMVPICSKWIDPNDKHQLTFYLEAGALISFGTSWLVKGEMVLKDKPKVGNATAKT
ncbi:hypothetical protein BDD43_4634 [Mucilaginibacter gracilis]|uniref:DUF998 domain-containing protein n=1 Tax=Mucilaginibacter gracilis TaxID=423350 RepID=A0A495J8M8_9SPHI|nr:hypothetical protein [Mucilaginibacter gracilis]RKR84399.1 hypothetical protein BDD43_4634 [Mucilaginibacter gracilis]